MTLEIKRGTEATTVKMVGRLDSFTAPVLERMINRLACDSPRIVLDMSEIEQVSEVGTSVLIGAHKKMSEIGSLKLMGMRDSVRESLIAGGADALAIG